MIVWHNLMELDPSELRHGSFYLVNSPVDIPWVAQFMEYDTTEDDPRDRWIFRDPEYHDEVWPTHVCLQEVPLNVKVD